MDYHRARMTTSRIKPIYFAAACFLFCAASVTSRWLDLPIVAGSTKVLASASFIACAFAAGALSIAYGQRVFVGLALSALGDVLLIGTTSMWFLAGLCSFLLAHICYGVAFWKRSISRPILLLASLPLIVFAAAFVWLLWPSLAPVMRVPVVAYVAAITTMVALAISTHHQRHNHWLWTGAVAFMVSDIAVSTDTFIAVEPIHFSWGLPLYYCAQLLLVRSIIADSLADRR